MRRYGRKKTLRGERRLSIPDGGLFFHSSVTLLVAHYYDCMSYQELTANGPLVSQDHWAIFVFYSNHTEQGNALSAREAQNQLHPLLMECDPGYATGMIVEMKTGDTFIPQQAPEDRKGYFTLSDDGLMKMISREEVYNLAISAYNVRAGRE